MPFYFHYIQPFPISTFKGYNDKKAWMQKEKIYAKTALVVPLPVILANKTTEE